MAYIARESAYETGTGIVVDTFTAGADFTAGTTSTLTLSIAPAGENSVWVFFNGIAQHQSQYTINNLVISFSEAIPANVSEISIQINTRLAIGEPGDGTVDYGKLTSGAVTSLQRKNAIINGNFDIWQRGTSQTATSYGSADRWGSYYQGTSATNTMSQQSFALGQTAVPNEPTYFLRNTVSSGTDTTTAIQIYQWIEGVRTFAGETITVSFWAKTSVALNITCEVFQNFGTGGTPSANVYLTPQKVACTTSWSKYELTYTVPSISGKSIGTNNDDKVALVFWFSGGSTQNTRSDTLGLQTGTFDIAQVQVEKGITATDFERRHIADELALCERYLQWLSPGAAANYARFGTGYWYGATTATVPVYFQTPMRAAPTFGYDGALSDYYININGGIGVGVPTAISTLAAAAPHTVLLDITYSTGGQTAGVGTTFCAKDTNTTNGIYFDAEL